MKGLLYKDMVNLGAMRNILLALLVFYLIVGVISKDTSFFPLVVVILALILPISSIAFDEQTKWHGYGLSLPVTRRMVVWSKYLLSLIMTVGLSLVSIVFCLFLVLWGDQSFAEGLLFTGLGAALSLLLVSIILPLLLKYGPDKGRVFIFLVVLIPTMLLMLLGEEQIVAILSMPVLVLAPCAALVIVLAFFLSVRISIGIFNKKEF